MSRRHRSVGCSLLVVSEFPLQSAPKSRQLAKGEHEPRRPYRKGGQGPYNGMRLCPTYGSNVPQLGSTSESLAPNLYYRSMTGFLEAGKKRLLRDTNREGTTPRRADLPLHRQENRECHEPRVAQPSTHPNRHAGLLPS